MKQILSEEFFRMQKLAGLSTESDYKEKISEADGYYYSYYKLNPNGNFYVYDLSNEIGVDFDDMDNKVYLNEN